MIFLNAFTDLGHKIIIQNTVFKVYDGSVQIVLTAIVNALILLPFILIFTPSGFLSDRFSKNFILKYSSAAAFFLTILITFFYYQGWFLAAFVMTFLLATQSAIYSPAKYGYIKELVGRYRLSSANAATQAVTTVAILGGIIFYSALFEMIVGNTVATQEQMLQLVAPLGWLLILGSGINWFLASKLPHKLAKSRKRFVIKKYLTGYYLYKNIKITKRKGEIFDAILALSFYWAISQVVLAIFAEYAKSEVGVTNALVVQGIMALAGIGIIIGCAYASRLSKVYINTALASTGALFIFIIVSLITSTQSLPVLGALFLLLGFFSGFILVPMNAYIQYLAVPVHMGTILATNNLIQNIFMIFFLLVTTLFAYFGMDATFLFYVVSLMALYLFIKLVMKDYKKSLRAFLHFMFSLRYDIRYHNFAPQQNSGAKLVLSTHVSWIDWAVLQFGFDKPLWFMMDRGIYKRLRFVLQHANIIALSTHGAAHGIKKAQELLQKGEIVALFPEGKIVASSDVGTINKGYMKIARLDEDFEIYALKIVGLHGSIFSRTRRFTLKNYLKRRKVDIYLSKPLPKDITPLQLKKHLELLGQQSENYNTDITS